MVARASPQPQPHISKHVQYRYLIKIRISFNRIFFFIPCSAGGVSSTEVPRYLHHTWNNNMTYDLSPWLVGDTSASARILLPKPITSTYTIRRATNYS